MFVHEFSGNVNVSDPGMTAGARFYAWVWRKHFGDKMRVEVDRLQHALDTEIAKYDAHFVESLDQNGHCVKIQFADEEQFSMFLLTWQGS